MSTMVKGPSKHSWIQMIIWNTTEIESSVPYAIVHIT